MLWGTAGITFSETTLCPVEIGAGGKRKRVGCGGGYNTYSISVNGDVYPCTYAVDYPQFKLGSIFDIDNYKVVKHITENDKRSDCKGCRYFYICQSGRCIFLNYKISGEFYRTSGFFCEYQKLEYKYNGL